MTEKLTSRKLAAVSMGILGVCAVAVMAATWGLENAEHYIIAILTLSGGGNVVQGLLDWRNGGGG